MQRIDATVSGFRRYWHGISGVLLIVPLGLFLWRCCDFGEFFAEDAYISFRFASHWADGHGLVWNVGGEPVEGYTSPLHVGLLAMAILGGASVGVAALAIGILAVVGLAMLYVWFLVRESDTVSPFAMLVLGLYLVESRLAVHATAGLDTTMQIFLLAANLAIVFRFVEAPGAGRAVAVTALHLLCLLGRPDAAPYIAAQCVVLIVAGLRRSLVHREKNLLRWSAVSIIMLVVLGVAFLGLKYLYFGYVLPNPYYIKANDISGLHGLRSVLRFIKSLYLLLIFLPALLLVDYERLWAWWRRPNSQVKAALLTLPALSFLAFCATVIPEVNYLSRFEYPVYFFAALTTGLLLSIGGAGERSAGRLFRRIGPHWASPLLAGGMIGVVGCLWTATWISFPWFEIVETRYYRPIAEALRSCELGPKATIVFDSAGVVPFVSQLSHLDPVGLTDNLLSGRNPLTAWEREDYIWNYKADVYIGPEPPAGPGAWGCADDPLIDTPYVQEVLLAEDRYKIQMGYLAAYGNLTMRERCDLLHRRMRELRDRWSFLGEIPFPVDAPKGYTTFAYVRNESPYREVLSRALEPVIVGSPEWLKVDRNDP